jgi:hypothetical protein
MKRVFFAVTVCTLAIAAASATKANSKVFANGYQNHPITGFCTVVAATNCGTGTNNCVDGSGAQVYQFNSSAACATALTKP